jgi:betaine-aldehyde dehydrogenase
MSGHEEVDLVSFTGGIETGKHIMKQAANHVTDVALELGLTSRRPLLIQHQVLN